MKLESIQFSLKIFKLTLLIVLMAVSQASAGFAICIAEPGHIEIEYADSACCDPTIPPLGQADELVEAEAPDCAACVDYEIGCHSLLNRSRQSVLNYSTQQNATSGNLFVTEIAWTTPVTFYIGMIPDQTQLVDSTIEKSSSPLRC